MELSTTCYLEEVMMCQKFATQNPGVAHACGRPWMESICICHYRQTWVSCLWVSVSHPFNNRETWTNTIHSVKNSQLRKMLSVTLTFEPITLEMSSSHVDHVISNCNNFYQNTGCLKKSKTTDSSLLFWATLYVHASGDRWENVSQSQSAFDHFHLVLLWPWPLSFWPQYLISSSLFPHFVVFALTNFYYVMTKARTGSPRTKCLRRRSNVQCAVRKSREDDVAIVQFGRDQRQSSPRLWDSIGATSRPTSRHMADSA